MLRHQLDLPKPSGHEKYAQIVRQFSEVLHFTAKSHNHLRSPSAFKGGSTQLWHQADGHWFPRIGTFVRNIVVSLKNLSVDHSILNRGNFCLANWSIVASLKLSAAKTKRHYFI